MELVTKKRLTIVAGRVNQELAQEVAERLSLGQVLLKDRSLQWVRQEQICV